MLRPRRLTNRLTTRLSKATSKSTATIAIWGAEGAGKTAFLAALEFAAKRERLSLYAIDGQTEKLMNTLRQRRSSHDFPTPTSMPQHAEDLTLLHFGVAATPSNSAITLNLADAAGRWWIAPDSARHGSARPFAPVFDPVFDPYDLILSKCDGLICLLDPTRALKRVHTPELSPVATMESHAEVELQSLLSQLCRARGFGNQPFKLKVALCLTKMDRAEHYGHLGKEERYFKKLYGTLPFDNWLPAKSWRYFGCSAAGVLQRAGCTISNTYIDQSGQELILDPQVPPLHVWHPIKWILGLA